MIIQGLVAIFLSFLSFFHTMGDFFSFFFDHFFHTKGDYTSFVTHDMKNL